jgi:predicted O-linked N-acetylglucosamine transferase (SPINDLY family)
LSRHAAADLFLDTLPYNAHTTGSDALWAGVPVVTCAGRSFAGRVGASLLDAIGLEELVTDTLDDYERLARELATTPERLKQIRLKLAANRTRSPLFDISRYARHIEDAYLRIFRNWAGGNSPVTTRISPLG